MSTYLLGIMASVGTLLFTVEVMRRGLIKERYAIIWTLTCTLMLFFSIFNEALELIAEKLSFQTPSNFLFFSSTLLLISIAVQYAFELGKLENQNKEMAIEIAIIKNEIKRSNEKR